MAFSQAVSGLNAAATNLDVIGNNGTTTLDEVRQII